MGMLNAPLRIHNLGSHLHALGADSDANFL